MLLDFREDVALLTLNRPEKGNSLSEPTLKALISTLEELGAKKGARCAILRGAGDKFSVGMDLNTLAASTPEAIQNLIGGKGLLRSAMRTVERFPYPVVAMIKGHAAGAGLELAVACDLRVGAVSCKVGMPPARLGIVYPPEGLMRFVQNVGLSATRKLFYTAQYFDADEARRMGLLDYTVPDEELGEFTIDLAKKVASNAPLSMVGHKRSLYLLTKSAPLSAAEKPELGSLMLKALKSADAREALEAFAEKRKPRFRGE